MISAANYTNSYERPWTEYSQSQKRTLNALYYVTPPFSLLGSLTIAYVVVKGKLISNHNFKPTFVRLLLGFSLVDIVHSLGYLILGPWAVPKGTPWVYNASGTVATCDAKAFFLHMSQGLWIYSTSLAIYHALKVRFEYRDAYITHRIEPWFHALAWFIPIFTGILLIPFGLMNPIASVPGYCTMSELPTGCDLTDDYDCERGENWFAAGIVLSVALSGICLLIISVSFVLIYLKVRGTEKRMARFGLAHRSSAANMELTGQVGRRAMYYIGAFFLCNLPTYVNWVGPPSETAENDKAVDFYFPLNAACFILFPLQGFLHALIFLISHPFVFREEGPLHVSRLDMMWNSAALSPPTLSDHLPPSEIEEEQGA
jgi:disulfide bond formation protein DsbB